MDKKFRESYEIGTLGEELLLGQWGWADLGWRAPADYNERRWDLERTVAITGGLETAEVKTDTYDHTRTPNFFMERHTNVAGGPRLVGGPWRGARDGVSVFVYVFLNPTPMAYAFYDVPGLVAAVESVGGATRRVGQGRLRATGLVVPRDAVCAEYLLHADRPLVIMGPGGTNDGTTATDQDV